VKERELYKVKRRLAEHCELFSTHYLEQLPQEALMKCYEQSLVKLLIRLTFKRRHEKRREALRMYQERSQ
jgi:hypothetical protein